MRYKRLVLVLKNDPVIVRVSFTVSVVYGIIYYWTAGFVHLNPPGRFGITIAKDIPDLIWHMRAPFQWEAIAILTIPKIIQVWISVPNLLIALILSLLVCGNLIIIMTALRHPTVCKIRKGKKSQSVIALLPAMFTGFACCAPTALILWVSVFGSVSTVMVAAMRWFLPLGLVLLTAGMISGYRSIPVDSTLDG